MPDPRAAPAARAAEAGAAPGEGRPQPLAAQNLVAHVVTRETGKPVREALGEAARVAATPRDCAADAALPHGNLAARCATGGQVSTRRRPRGAVGLITPWSFPVAIPARTEVGPLINERRHQAVLVAMQQARAGGGRLVAGGDVPGRPRWFVAPTLFGDVADDAPPARQEAFGPVNEAQAGVIHVNSPTTGAEVHVPFGGARASGWGPKEQGRAALDFDTESVTVYEDA